MAGTTRLGGGGRRTRSTGPRSGRGRWRGRTPGRRPEPLGSPRRDRSPRPGAPPGRRRRTSGPAPDATPRRRPEAEPAGPSPALPPASHQGPASATGNTWSRITGPLARIPRPIPRPARAQARAPPPPCRRRRAPARAGRRGCRRPAADRTAGRWRGRRTGRSPGGPTRPGAPGRAAPAEQATEGDGQHQGAGQTEGGHEPRPPVDHAEERPAGVDQPEQQRRLVGVGHAVQVGYQEVPGAPHLPRHREIPGLVDRNRRPGHQGHRGEHPQQAQGNARVRPHPPSRAPWRPGVPGRRSLSARASPSALRPADRPRRGSGPRVLRSAGLYPDRVRPGR